MILEFGKEERFADEAEFTKILFDHFRYYLNDEDLVKFLPIRNPKNQQEGIRKKLTKKLGDDFYNKCSNDILKILVKRSTLSYDGSFNELIFEFLVENQDIQEWSKEREYAYLARPKGPLRAHRAPRGPSGPL